MEKSTTFKSKTEGSIPQLVLRSGKSTTFFDMFKRI